MLLQKIRNKVGGFTLIEMLIVISIIAIFAAIVIPMIGMMMESSGDSDGVEIEDQEPDPDEAEPVPVPKPEEESGGDKL